MQTKFGFQVYTSEELFIDTLNNLYQDLFPKEFQNFTYSLHFLDAFNIERSEDITKVSLLATDTICSIPLPVISFIITPKQEDDGWLIIQANLNPYHSNLLDYRFEEIVIVLAAQYREASLMFITASDSLVKKPLANWKGEKIGVLAKKMGVIQRTLIRMIDIEEIHVPAELTEKAMGEIFKVQARVIRIYVNNMKQHREYFPGTVARFGELKNNSLNVSYYIS